MMKIVGCKHFSRNDQIKTFHSNGLIVLSLIQLSAFCVNTLSVYDKVKSTVCIVHRIQK